MRSHVGAASLMGAGAVIGLSTERALAQCQEPWFEPRLAHGATVAATVEANEIGRAELVGTDAEGLAVWTFDEDPAPVRTTVYAGEPLGTVVADFNSDGHHDIAALTNEPTMLRVFRNALGAWPEIVSLPAIEGALIVLDHGGDGDPDLVVAGATSTDLFENQGGGTFSPATPIAPAHVGRAWTARVDADGLDDIVRSLHPGTTLAYLQQADGTFLEVQTDGLYAAFVADVNGDALADLVLDDACDCTNLAPGIGNGAFGEPFTIVPDHVIPRLLADLDGDGDADLMSVDEIAAGFVIDLNDGSGNFTRRPELLTGLRKVVAATDATGDGTSDLLALSRAGALVLRGRGDGTFDQPPSVQPLDFARRLVVGDLDMDGAPDAVLAGEVLFEGAISVLANDGAGDLSIVTTQGGSDFKDGIVYEAPVIADFDGDGDQDIAFWSGNELFLVENTPDGLWSTRRTLPAVDACIRCWWASCLSCQIFTSDFNNDGRPDLLLPDDQSPYGLRFLLNAGAWAFSPVTMDVIPYEILVGVCDVTGDAIDDVILTTDNDPTAEIGVLPGRADGTFDALRSSNVARRYNWVFPGDFDGDGDLDLLAVQYKLSLVMLLRNDGSGRFHDLGQVAQHYEPRGIGVYDLNRDGIDDFVVGDQQGVAYGLAAAYLSRGNGTFSQVPLHSPGGMTSAALADMNADGTTDLVAAHNPFSPNGGPGVVTVLLNECPGNPCPVDLNLDGIVDSRDVIRFLQLWATGDQNADWNRDDVVDTRDIIAFLNAWTAGCD